VGDALGSSDAGSLSSGARFDAFTYGGALMNEELQDRARAYLEACDHLQGIQAVVDIDSGFGSLAVEYLLYLREECPRVALLTMGALAPHAHHDAAVANFFRATNGGGGGGVSGGKGGASSGGDVNATYGGFDYADRDRSTVRAVNVGMAFASFAGAQSDLGGTFIPLSMQPYADAVEEAARAAVAEAVESGQIGSASAAAAYAAWFPGLVRPHSHRHYQTSALLAAGWDTFTAPFRRSAGFGDAMLPAVAAVEGGARPERAIHEASSTGVGGQREAADTRERHNHGADKRNWFDPAIEMASERPSVGLADGVSMGEQLALLAPSPHLRLTTLAMTFPFPHPRASATTLDRILAGLPPSQALGLDVAQPLSWTCALPASAYRRRAGSGAAGSPPGSGHGGFAAATPFAHLLIARGIGSHSVSSGGAYTSSRDAYGRVLESYLSRTQCATAGHTLLRTPLPVPVTFPHLFPRHMYDGFGGYVGGHARGVGLPPTISGDTADAASAVTASAGSGGVPLPYSAPSLLYAATGPGYAPALRRVHADFARRDRSVLHRFGVVDRTSGSSGGLLDFEDAQNALAQLVDDYAPSGGEGGSGGGGGSATVSGLSGF
jgi:hypothetical protein